MIAKVLGATNLYKAARQVIRNKGACGIDGISCSELSEYIRENRAELLLSISNHSYLPQAILGVTIPKGKGGFRLLGIPAVIDRWL